MEPGANDRVVVDAERPTGSGWSFRLHVGTRTRTLTLSWADYNHWSADGADPPHAVALAVARFLLSRLDVADLPAALDASWSRRRFADADEVIPGMIG